MAVFAKRERHDGDEREAAVGRQHADGEPQVLKN
jgi:hypothetical protein